MLWCVLQNEGENGVSWEVNEYEYELVIKRTTSIRHLLTFFHPDAFAFNLFLPMVSVFNCILSLNIHFLCYYHSHCLTRRSLFAATLYKSFWLFLTSFFSSFSLFHVASCYFISYLRFLILFFHVWNCRNWNIYLSLMWYDSDKRRLIRWRNERKKK